MRDMKVIGKRIGKGTGIVAICALCLAVMSCGKQEDSATDSTTKQMEAAVEDKTTKEVNETSSEELTSTEEVAATTTETPTTTTEAQETTTEETTTVAETVTTTKEQTTSQQETTTAISVTDMNKTMYSTTSLNVRSGPSADYDKLGSLKTGQQVKVTGKTEQTGWYRIEYNGKTGYVSGKYLQDEPVTEAATQETTKASNQTTSSSVEKILNGAAQNPWRSDFEPLNEQVDKLFSEIFKDGMTTYDKVKACYDYLINNCSYGYNECVYDYIEAYFYGYQYEVSAYGLLKGHIGVCDDYSATFAMLMRYIGLDCYVVGGQTSKSGGGYTGHAWCEMSINGMIYVFDPQVEDNIAKGGTINYYRFCKTYDQVSGKYIKEQ